MAEQGTPPQETIDPKLVEKAKEVNATAEKPTAAALRRAIEGLGGKLPPAPAGKTAEQPAAPAAPVTPTQK